MTRIEHWPLAQVVAGTEVAADVMDGQGCLLLSGGSVLSERMREQLVRRGVETLPVRVEESLAEEEFAARRAALEAQLTERFSCVRGQPLMEQMLQLVLHYRLEHM